MNCSPFGDDFILIDPAISQIDDADIVTRLSMKMLNPVVIIDHYLCPSLVPKTPVRQWYLLATI